MKKVSVILFFITLVFSCKNVHAIETKFCEFSKEFQEWLELTDEEKSKTEFVPTVCNIDKKTAVINNITANSYAQAGEENYPSSYSLVNLNQVSPVRNQMQTGTCWAFVSNEIIESTLLKKNNVQLSFSSRHLEYYTSRNFLDGINYNGLNRVINTGGNYFMSMAYYKNNYGPILESEMPFENNMNPLYLSSVQNKTPAVDVNTSFILANGDGNCTDSIKNAIKDHIMNHGAVGTAITMEKRPNIYYNELTNAYYYDGADATNHAVTIVGWDDNYAVTNFSSSKRPSTPGAWIIKNSYGTTFGDNGYFYMSYNDINVCRLMSGIYDVDFDFPDKLYTYNKYGYNTSIRFVNQNTVTSSYMATKFTKPATKEYLSEITVGAYKYTNVDLYVIPTNMQLSIDNATKVGNVTIPYGGYATYKIDKPIELPDTTFYIIAKYTHLASSGPTVSINIENSPWDVVKSNYGESYVSIDGIDYTDLMVSLSGEQANAAITAGTLTQLEKISTDTTKKYNLYNNKISEETISVSTNDIADNSNLTVKVLNKSNNSDQTSKFTISNNKVVANEANVKISAKNTALAGNYIIQISFDGQKVELDLKVEKYEYVTSIIIDDAIVEIGSDLQLLPVVQPATAVNKELKMTSSDQSIFTVNNGKIHGVKVGNANLIIESTDGSGVQKTINVKVVELFNSTSNYELDGTYIVNVAPETTYQEVLSNFLEPNTIKIYNLKEKEVTSGNIGSGFKLKKTESGKTTEYIFIVLGDANGDGVINSSDLLRLRQHLLEIITLNNENFYASDITKDNKINSSDLLRIRQHLLGITIIG